MIQEATRVDQQRLQGTWRLTSGAVGGQPDTMSAAGSVIITGDKIVIALKSRWEGTFTLDPARSPRRIGLTATSRDGKDTEETRGVYELQGDELHLCLAFGDEARPAKLRSSTGTSEISLVLKRERP